MGTKLLVIITIKMVPYPTLPDSGSPITLLLTNTVGGTTDLEALDLQPEQDVVLKLILLVGDVFDGHIATEL